MTKIYVWCTACDKRVESIYMLFKGNHIINRLECGCISKTTFESVLCGIPSNLKTENLTDNYISSILHKKAIEQMSDDKDLSKE